MVQVPGNRVWLIRKLEQLTVPGQIKQFNGRINKLITVIHTGLFDLDTRLMDQFIGQLASQFFYNLFGFFAVFKLFQGIGNSLSLIHI